MKKLAETYKKYPGKYIPAWRDWKGRHRPFHLRFFPPQDAFFFFFLITIGVLDARKPRALERSVLYKRDYLVPRKARPLFGPNRHWVLAYARWEASSHSIRFFLSMVHCARLCTIAIPNVARFILIHAARSETREGPRMPHESMIESRRRDASSVLSTVALHFFPLLSYAPRRRKWNYYAPRRAGMPLSYCSHWMHFAGSWAHFPLCDSRSNLIAISRTISSQRNGSCNILHDLILSKQCRFKVKYICRYEKLRYYLFH